MKTAPTANAYPELHLHHPIIWFHCPDHTDYSTSFTRLIFFSSVVRDTTANACQLASGTPVTGGKKDAKLKKMKSYTLGKVTGN